MKSLKLLLPLALGLIALPLLAQRSTSLEIVETPRESVSEKAARWGLTEAQWREYLQIMGDRRGTWSPGLDPITALGVSADTTAERNRYAELYVRTEFERTRKELAFHLAVDRAWVRLYPDTPRLQSRAIPKVASESTVRYALIVSTECPECEGAVAGRLTRMLENAQEGVDIHVVGTEGDDQVLRDWIARQPEVLVALKEGRVTVNHGHQFADLAAFPAIYAKTKGSQWSREL